MSINRKNLSAKTRNIIAYRIMPDDIFDNWSAEDLAKYWRPDNKPFGCGAKVTAEIEGFLRDALEVYPHLNKYKPRIRVPMGRAVEGSIQ